MFIVKKNISGGEYFYIRESVREGGKVKSKTLGYAGKTPEEANKKLIEMKSEREDKNSSVEKHKNGQDSDEVMIEEQKDDEGSVKKDITIEDLTQFCKRKGFVYPSGEIYGGLAGFWDFGPIGVELKNNIKQSWWNFHIRQRDDVVGIDGSIITNPKVWEASGHVASFVDVAVVCKKCGFKTKVDKHEVATARCDKCKGEYENKGEFNPMFTTGVGPIKEDSIKAYLRPETAQLIFADFKFVRENSRMNLPFGIAQIGKAFRNEIAPRDFLFRCREFEQMEMEYFVNPKNKCSYEIGNSEILVYSAEMQKNNEEPVKMKFKEAFEKGIIKTDWHAYWLEQEFLWFTGLGASKNKFRIRQHMLDEKSHYALDTWDLEFEFPFGWKELQGMANRTDFDLKQHQEHSKVNLEIVDVDGTRLLPHVVCEPSQGVERAFLVFMADAYNFNEKRQNIVLKLHPRLSPIKAAIFPIIKSPEYEKLAEEIVKDLRKEFSVVYDKSGSIGRRYARNDEIGTPMCITIDEESLKTNSITIRDRDSTKQIRAKISELKEIVRSVVDGESLLKFGKLVETRVKE
jgi:glycyl-tRNA synthetase